MAPLSSNHAAASLNLLANAALERSAQLQQYNTIPTIDSDQENESDCPIFDRFYNEDQSKAIIEMTNFDALQFHSLWMGFQSYIASNYNTGRGRKCAQSPKDVFFMTLTVLKHGGQWDFTARLFNFKASAFERMIMKFVRMLSPAVYEHFVQHQAKHGTMKQLHEQQKTFSNYPMARYATDVTFQPSFRPSGNVEEGKKYFSGKHKQYGYKVEVSVLPNGQSIGCSLHEPASVSDLTLFQQMQWFHRKNLSKLAGEENIEDDGPLKTTFPTKWIVLADKGYQGAAEFIRIVHPKRKPQGGFLSPGEVAMNRFISSDRIIVENYFGRLCTLWNVLSRKWRWAETAYDGIFRLCLGLTNYHVINNPLRAVDGELYTQVSNRWYSIGNTQLERRRQIQKRYRERRRRNMDRSFRATMVPDEQDGHASLEI